jgi:hypothetical protein
VYFSREKLAAADPNTAKADIGRYVDRVKVWTEEVRKKGGNPASPRSYRRARKKAARQFVMRVNDPSLRRALLRHRPERIIRQAAPPYDTVRVRRGRTVNYPDLSLDYGIVFPDSTRRNQFLEDVNGLSSVADASKPMTAEDFDLNVGNVINSRKLCNWRPARMQGDRHRDGLSRFFSLQFSGLVGSLPLEECVHGQASPSR